mgnify:CR=1 FL=1
MTYWPRRLTLGLAVGARTERPFELGITFGEPGARDALGGLLADLEDRHQRLRGQAVEPREPGAVDDVVGEDGVRTSQALRCSGRQQNDEHRCAEHGRPGEGIAPGVGVGIDEAGRVETGDAVLESKPRARPDRTSSANWAPRTWASGRSGSQP